MALRLVQGDRNMSSWISLGFELLRQTHLFIIHPVTCSCIWLFTKHQVAITGIRQALCQLPGKQSASETLCPFTQENVKSLPKENQIHAIVGPAPNACAKFI